MPSTYKRHQYLSSRARMNDILAAFRQAGCALCGEKNPACLAAHHVRKKSHDIGKLCEGTGSHKKLIAELAKCVCLCHNCHFKLHAIYRRFP